MRKKNINISDLLLKKVIAGMKEMKGINIKVLDFKKIETSFCKYFVICSGTSNTHVASISHNVKKYVSREIKENPLSTEGKENYEWVLLDYADVVVHVFQDRIREFYRLEDLWADAKIKNIKKFID